MENIKVAVVYHSGYGHTEAMAKSVATGVEKSGARVDLVNVTDLESIDWEALKAADALIFGSPTYMGSVSGPFKMFMDATAGIWQEQGWQDKLAAGFTNSASQSGDKLNTLIQLSVFSAQHGMNWVSLGLPPGNNASTRSTNDLNRIGSYLGAMAQSNADESAETAPPEADHRTAEHLGARVALAAQRWQA